MELRQEKRVYEMPHRLTYYECDDTGHPTLSMMLSMMTMVSDAHSISLGMDTATIQQTGGAWVITEYDGEVANEQPQFGDQVILGTRALAYNRFFALREFWMTDANHEKRYLHLRATFVFMNLAKRRLMSIPKALIEPFASPEQKRLPRLAKPAGLTDADPLCRQYQVRYFDIDVNHHVNNARYLDWLLDPLGGEFLRTHRPVRLVIKYEHEVRENTTVTSQCQLVREPDGLTSRHALLIAGQVCATAEIGWVMG
ncbi:MAG: acyl-[acyl-carrier-protein] thioesterase [Limosilactobacillus sp.]